MTPGAAAAVKWAKTRRSLCSPQACSRSWRSGGPGRACSPPSRSSLSPWSCPSRPCRRCRSQRPPRRWRSALRRTTLGLHGRCSGAGDDERRRRGRTRALSGRDRWACTGGPSPDPGSPQVQEPASQQAAPGWPFHTPFRFQNDIFARRTPARRTAVPVIKQAAAPGYRLPAIGNSAPGALCWESRGLLIKNQGYQQGGAKVGTQQGPSGIGTNRGKRSRSTP